MNYTAIGQALQTLLQTISGMGSSVYNYEPFSIEKSPCITIRALGHKDKFADTAANIRNYQFMLTLCYRISEDNQIDCEAVLRDLTDSVLAVLENKANISLNGTCDYIMPSTAVWGYQEREVPVRVVEITVEVFKRVNR